MGWIVADFRPPGESHAVFFQREILRDDQEIIASAHVGGIGGTFYAAVRDPDGTVWAAVILTSGCAGGEFGWKSQSEHMGPYEDRCPAVVLDALTQTDDDYAKDWRARCRARLARLAARPRPRPGVRLTFPLDFLTPEGPCKTFEVVDPKRGLFRRDADSPAYRLRGWRGEEYALAGKEDAS